METFAYTEPDVFSRTQSSAPSEAYYSTPLSKGAEASDNPILYIGLSDSGAFVAGAKGENRQMGAGEVLKLADLLPYEAGNIVNMDAASNDAMKFVVKWRIQNFS